MKTKRILSMLLAVVMVCSLLPTVAFAVEEPTLYVAGVAVTSDNLEINSADNGAITGSATYDPSTNTLTLDNFSYTGEGYEYNPSWYCAAIYFNPADENAELTIELVGTNTVIIDNSECTSYAIYIANGNLIIEGNGSLTATGDTGIYAWGNISISGENTSVIATGNYGIQTNGGDIDIDGGKVEANGGYNGIVAYGNISISGGEVRATATYESGTGIYAEGNIDIDGGKVEANGGYGGIYADGNIDIDGDKVDATGSLDYGIYAAGPLTINGGIVTVKGSEAGIYVENNITIDSGTVKATASGDYGIGIVAYAVTVNGGTVEAMSTGEYGYGITTYDDGISCNGDFDVYAGESAPGELVTSPTTSTYNSKYVKITPVPPHTNHCICGKTHAAVGDHTAEEEKTFTAVSTYDDLVEAAATGGSVYLTGDITLEAPLTVSQNLSLCLNGYDLIYNSADSVIIVSNSKTLNITDCGSTGTITGSTGDYGAVQNGTGTFNLYAGTITGNKRGVYNGGTFSMYGGNIAGNSDDGVWNRSTFNLYGSKITYNTGWGVNNNGGTFTMNGGEISHNSHNAAENAVKTGVMNDGTFTMNSGKISDNSGDGVMNNSLDSKFIMNDGEISGNSGDGVYNPGTFTMYDGEISSNTGDGVYTTCGFTMNGGEISGNDRGVMYVDGTASVSGAPVIQGNTNGNFCDYQDGYYLTVSGALTDGAYIGVTLEEKFGEAAGPSLYGGTLPAASNYIEYFYSDDEGLEVFAKGDSILIGNNITEQPDAENGYTVKTNDDENAKYQWYRVETDEVPVTYDFLVEQDIGFNGMYGGNFDSETNKWTPKIFGSTGGYGYLFVALDAGETFIAEFDSAVPAGYIVLMGGWDNDNVIQATQQNGNIYTFKATEAGQYILVVVTEDEEPTALSEVVFPNVICKMNALVYTPLDGQASPTLDTTNLTTGTYACKVTWNMGTPGDTSDDYTLTSAMVPYTASYTVTVSADPAEGGTVSGGDSYDYGETVTLMATANPGYKFVNWTMNGTEVNTDATYSFTATENAEYVANFVESHTHCICGETHKAIGTHTTEENPTWVAISSADDFTKNKDSGYYYLTDDIEVSAKWEFTQSRDIVLCLNGYDITYTGSSNVSFIPSSSVNFTLTDCKAEAGSISGFKNTYGGAINVKKAFTMYNGKITGNTASQGGGVYVDQNATFYMYGGEITGNTASSLGGGVYIKGSMEVAGAPVVNNNENSNTGTSYQNKMSAFTKNIYSSNDAVVVGTGGLTAGAKLDVTPKFPVSSSERPAAVATIATGCTSDLSAYFTYTSGFNYTKQYDATEGKVQLVYAPVKYTVTFNMQGHGTQVEEQSVETDTYATEPSPAPTAQGYTFGGWYTTPECGYWDDFIFDFFKITEDKTLYAKWTLNAPAISGAEGYTADYDGASHEINVTVDSVSNLSYSYQWYKDGKAEENEIDSATSATYSVKNVADSGTYYCKVTVSDGSSTNSGWSDAVTVAIAKVSVAVPVISSKAYTGNTLTADITDTADYTVTTNNGGVSAGSYEVVLTLNDSTNYKWADSNDEAKTLEFAITKAGTNTITGLSIANWTYGETPNAPTAAATFGAPAFTYVGTGSTVYAESATAPTNAGTYKVIAKVADTENHVGASDEAEFVIAKANPSYTIPTGLTATYGNTLANVTLPNGWSWKDATTTSVGNAGTNSFVAIYTPDDTANYNTAEATVSVAVSKANPEYTAPTGLNATYGNTLADVDLPDGWSWKDEITTSVGNAGTNDFVATFTPADVDNYNTAEATVSIAVAKANPSYTIPTGLNATYGDTLADVTLPTGWTWKDADTTGVGNAGTKTFAAVFTPDDTDNYNTVEADLEVNVVRQKVAKPAENTTVFTYNGNEQIYTLTENARYEITNNKRTDAGEQTVTVTLNDKHNYRWDDNTTDDVTFTFTIAQKEIGIVWGTTQFTYNKTEQKPTATATGLVTGDSCEIAVTGGQTNAGNGYVATAKSLSNANYKLPTSKTTTFNIAQKSVAITGITIEATKVYDRETNAVITNYGIVSNVIDGDIVTVNTASATATYNDANVGNGKAVAFAGFAISGADASNYELSAQPANTTANITAKDIAGAVITLGESLTYNGNEQTQTIASATVDGLTITYEVSGNVNTNAGDYTLTITGNENFTGTAQKAYTIAKRDATLETVPSAITPLTYNAAEQTLVSAGENVVGGTLMYKLGDGEYSAELPKATNAGSYTVYYKVIGDSNHNDTEEQNFEVTISQKVVSPAIVLTTPVPNQTPVTNIETDEYTATIAWSPDVTDKFAYSTDYTATITITPKDNYTLTGVTENGYTIEGATVTNPADSGVITAVFPKTSSRPSSGGGTTRYTVKFDTDGGSEIASKTVTRNSKVAEPTAPEKEGYTFMGWFTDESLTVAYDFDSKVTKSFTLYAKWTEIEKEPEDTDTHNCPSKAFADLDTAAWYHLDTDYAIENGIFKGVTETTFAPNDKLTRAMLVTVLYRVEGEPATNRSIPFADVDMGAYYASAVSWAKQVGIVNGVSETEFAPDANITREQIAAIMMRYAVYKGMDAITLEENLHFADANEISEYAVSSMNWAVGSGLINGKSESLLAPKDNATRAEVAAILHRYLNMVTIHN